MSVALFRPQLGQVIRVAGREVSEPVRVYVLALLESWCSESSKADVAREIGVSKATVGKILQDGQLGLKVAFACATKLGIGFEELEKRANEVAVQRYGPSAVEPQVRPHKIRNALGNHPQWPEVEKRLLQTYSAAVVERTGEMQFGAGPVEFLDYEFARKLADALAYRISRQS